jgi:hypothetical protein
MRLAAGLALCFISDCEPGYDTLQLVLDSLSTKLIQKD